MNAPQTIATYGKSIDTVKTAVKAFFTGADKAADKADEAAETLTQSIVYSFPSATPTLEQYKAHRAALTLALSPMYTSRRDDRDEKKGKADASRAISQCIETAHDQRWFVNPTPPRVDAVKDAASVAAGEAAKRIISAIQKKLQTKGKDEATRTSDWAALVALDHCDPFMHVAFEQAIATMRRYEEKQKAEAERVLRERIIAEYLAEQAKSAE